MAVLGFGSLVDTSLPTLWEEAYLEKVRLQEGRSFEDLIMEVRDGLQVLNGTMLQMPHYSSLFAVQDTPDLEYPVGVSNGFTEATEFGRPDPQRGKTTGHMLPIVPYHRALGWSMMYLRKARASKLDADVRSMFIDARNIWQQKLLDRFFDDSANTVPGTSTAGDVPFADGGSADSNYVPPDSPEGESFTSSHDHIHGYSADASLTNNTIDQDAINFMAEHLEEHGHMAPFDLIGARADASDYGNTTNVTGWKAPNWDQIAYHASGTERADIPDIGEFFGFIETDYGLVRVWLTPRVPTMHLGLYKAYGAGDPRNPLRVRIDQNIGFGFNLVPGNWVNAPTQYLLAYTEFGVGVGADRTNGVIVDLAAGSYSAPTIS